MYNEQKGHKDTVGETKEKNMLQALVLDSILSDEETKHTRIHYLPKQVPTVHHCLTHPYRARCPQQRWSPVLSCSLRRPRPQG